MKVEQWLERYLSENVMVTDLLAVYNKKPAIFYQEAPASSIIYWKNGKKYPQIHYMVCKEEKEEGYRENKIEFRLLSSKDDNALFLMEQALKKCFEHMVVQFEPGLPNYLTWLKTNALKHKEKQDLESNIIGMKVHFHMIELPSQENMDPDPIWTLSRFIDLNIPGIMQIENTSTEQVQQVEHKQPVSYIRFTDLKVEEETNTVVWLEGTLSIHILAASQDVKMKWMLLILSLLSVNGEIRMSDYSPMWIRDVQMNNHADYKREGQIQVTVRYGLPKYDSKKTAIQHIGFAGMS